MGEVTVDWFSLGDSAVLNHVGGVSRPWERGRPIGFRWGIRPWQMGGSRTASTEHRFGLNWVGDGRFGYRMGFRPF